MSRLERVYSVIVAVRDCPRLTVLNRGSTAARRHAAEWGTFDTGRQ